MANRHIDIDIDMNERRHMVTWADMCAVCTRARENYIAMSCEWIATHCLKEWNATYLRLESHARWGETQCILRHQSKCTMGGMRCDLRPQSNAIYDRNQMHAYDLRPQACARWWETKCDMRHHSSARWGARNHVHDEEKRNAIYVWLQWNTYWLNMKCDLQSQWHAYWCNVKCDLRPQHYAWWGEKTCDLPLQSHARWLWENAVRYTNAIGRR